MEKSTVPEQRTWLRFSNEEPADSGPWTADEWAAAAAATAEDEAEVALWLRRIVVGLVVFVFLIITDVAGFDLGPAGSHRAACSAAGGSEIDLLVAHHCAPQE